MEVQDKPKDNVLTLKLNYKWIVIALLVVIAAMVAMWQPWTRISDRTIEVSGQSTVSAVPDEYAFSPYYEFKNSDKQAALSDLTKKSDEIVAKLKELGVANEKIKTNSNGYDYPIYNNNTSTPTYNLSLTITVDNSDLAQKVQDYLVTTSPLGSVTPQATFSDNKRNELESKARDEATKDARAKAEQSAKNLGFSIGAVKVVNDGGGFGSIIYPMGSAAENLSADSAKLSLQPGENDLRYTVSVVYFIY